MMSSRRDAAERRARAEATPSTSRHNLDSDSGSVRSSRSAMSQRLPPGDPQAALFHAARHGRVNELRSLVMSGADLHKPDAKGQSVLHSVAKHGHIQVSARFVSNTLTSRVVSTRAAKPAVRPLDASRRRPPPSRTAVVRHVADIHMSPTSSGRG